MASRADLVAEACYRAACEQCGSGPRACVRLDGGGYRCLPESRGDCPVEGLRAAVAALPPLPDLDAASAEYEAPPGARHALDGCPWAEAAALDRVLRAIHARCFGRGPDGEVLPPEQTPRGNRLAVIAAACEMALAGEEVCW